MTFTWSAAGAETRATRASPDNPRSAVSLVSMSTRRSINRNGSGPRPSHQARLERPDFTHAPWMTQGRDRSSTAGIRKMGATRKDNLGDPCVSCRPKPSRLAVDDVGRKRFERTAARLCPQTPIANVRNVPPASLRSRRKPGFAPRMSEWPLVTLLHTPADFGLKFRPALSAASP